MADDDGEQSIDEALSTVISGGARVFLGKGIALTMGFLTQLLMARLLTSGQYGSVVVTFAILGFLGIFTNLGLAEGMVRNIPKYEDESDVFRGVARAGIFLSGSIAFLTAGMLFTLAPLISSDIFKNPDLEPLIRIGSIALPFTVIGKVSVAIARGARNATPHTIVHQVIRPILRFIFIGVLFAGGFEAVGAVTGQVVAFSIAGLIGFWYAYRTIPFITGPSTRMYRTMLVFSLPLVLVQGMNFLLSNIDTFLIEYFLTSSDVGIYNIAFQIRNLVIVCLVTVGFLLPPMLSKLETQGQYEELRSIYRFVTKWTVILTFPLFMSLIFVPHLWLGLLFGKEYLPGILTLQILGVGIMYSAMMGVSKSALVGLGRNRVVMFTTLVAVIVNIFFNIILIPQLGIEGAALGTTVSVIVLESLNLYVLYNSFGIVPLSTQTVFVLFGTGLVGAGVYELLGGQSPLNLFGWCILYAIAIAATSISESDIRIGRRLIVDLRQ